MPSSISSSSAPVCSSRKGFAVEDSFARPDRAHRRSRLVLAGFLLAVPVVALAAGDVHDIVQKGRAFQLKAIEIARGDILRFVNDDEFLHQIYVKSPSFNVDSAEQAPREHIDVAFTA